MKKCEHAVTIANGLGQAHCVNCGKKVGAAHYCKNCGHAIVKELGQWWHVVPKWKQAPMHYTSLRCEEYAPWHEPCKCTKPACGKEAKK